MRCVDTDLRFGILTQVLSRSQKRVPTPKAGVLNKRNPKSPTCLSADRSKIYNLSIAVFTKEFDPHQFQLFPVKITIGQLFLCNLQ